MPDASAPISSQAAVMPEVDIDDAGDATVAWEGAAGVVAATGRQQHTAGPGRS